MSTPVDLQAAGVCYETIGRVDKARPLYEEALKMSSTQLPSDHPNVALGKMLDDIHK